MINFTLQDKIKALEEAGYKVEGRDVTDIVDRGLHSEEKVFHNYYLYKDGKCVNESWMSYGDYAVNYWFDRELASRVLSLFFSKS